LLAHGRWFSQSYPASSTTKTGRRDIAEILLKVALKHQNQNQSNLVQILFDFMFPWCVLLIFLYYDLFVIVNKHIGVLVVSMLAPSA
jgi:hypothetical protein